ncbi:MAG: hypothetical protein SF051_05300 [Elusimicrobiota bacterium]|nr:hypothetical protein [Elusimicrobiota bacterium]
MADNKVSELYKKAIKELQAVIAHPDTDDATREEADKKLKSFRTKAQDAALDAIVARTQNLQGFMNDLQAVAAKADHSDSSAGVAKLKGLIGEAKGLIDLGKGLS